MEQGTITREIYIEATPEIVFDVVSNPDHVRQWWPDEARYELTPGATGQIAFGESGTDQKVETFTVVDVDPPTHFAFRWIHPAGEAADVGNSLLVTFDLVASGTGTLVRLSESGFRELGWEAAVLEQCYNDHVHGWDYFLPRLAPYVRTLGVAP